MSSIRNAYDQWAMTYDQVENKTRDMDAVALISSLGPYKFHNALELGCGTGKNTAWLAQHSDVLTAVDFSDEMIAIAKTKITAPNVNFQQADINQEWNFPLDAFDLVTFNLVLEHIEDLETTFKKAFKVLKKDGILFISELHPYKQYTGSKARFEKDGIIKVLDTFTHHLTDYLNSAKKSKLTLVDINEWFDEIETIPRLISFIFKKE